MAHVTPDVANPDGKIDFTQIKSPSEVADEAALQIAVQDCRNTETWIQTNYWGLRWREADALYQSPPGILMWEGTTMPRANVNRFVVAETVNTIHEQVLNGLFYETPAFVLRPRPNQDENTTRAIKDLLATQLDEINFRQEVDWGIHNCLLFGTGIWKWGYEAFKEKTLVYKEVGQPLKMSTPMPGQDVSITTEESMQFEEVEDEVDVYRPTFENKDIRYTLVDPGCKVPDIRKAKFVIDRLYMTYRDLIKKKDEKYITTDPVTKKKKLVNRYNLPSEKEIREWFEPPRDEPGAPDPTVATSLQNNAVIHHAKPRFQASTVDPLDEPLEVIERWDNDKVITVLQRVKVIRNEPNEFKCIPYFSVNWWNIPDAFWGLGLGRVIGVEQRVQAGLINACLDLANLIVNPMWVRAEGANVQTQQIRQRIGGIITVGGGLEVGKAFSMLEQANIPAEVIQQIALSESRVEKTSGASQAFVSGATTGRAGAARSGTGAAAMINATMSRIGATAEGFVRQVMEPFLYKMHELNKRKTPIPYIKKILGDKVGGDWSTFNPTDYMKAPVQFEVLAGSHLAAKAQMAQSLFLMIQLFETPQLLEQLNQISQGIVDIEELFHMVHDISGWKNYYKVVRPMTEQEKANQQAQSAAAQAQSKVSGQMQLQNQKFNQQQQLLDSENNARVVRDMLRHLAEKGSEPEVLSGALPTEGVGSQEQG